MSNAIENTGSGILDLTRSASSFTKVISVAITELVGNALIDCSSRFLSHERKWNGV
ncbi:hypothetical protein [Roseinatronobacter sp. S2]|uniref:hypothetical protein n=1 Tax=Roseinatronobacter sp. S2 TaxID=3035471 RepID=UPI00240FBB50|nr:hypothetical protein [Roseinatronobacter sp. S2]WFE76634.1 hypothetical protein P8S53_19140 [Roseinatronobacter sp. S2]